MLVPSHLKQLHEFRGRFPVLRIDIHPDTRESIEEVREPRNSHSPSAKGSDAVEVEESIPGIELLNLGTCERPDSTRAFRRAVHTRIVDHDNFPIAGEMNIHL
jgi:hypothetical protein